jgi:ferredoxin-type protein NapH
MKRISSASLRILVIIVVAVVILVGYIIPLDIGNLSALGIDVIAAICPLGILETSLASLTLVPRAFIALLLALLFVAVFGKAFCAWICPTPLLQRWFPGRKRKKKELDDEIAAMSKVAEVDTGDERVATKMVDADVDTKPAIGADAGVKALCGKQRNLKFDSRHLVLGGSLLSAAIFGFPVFCLICPVGLTFASMLVLYRLFGFGEVTWTVVIFPLILIFELVVFRKWCSKLCPLGALLSLAAGINRLFRPRIDDSKCLITKGISCTICTKACAREKIDLRHPIASEGALSDCTKCRDCAEACPVNAISFPLLTRAKDVDENKEAA